MPDTRPALRRPKIYHLSPRRRAALAAVWVLLTGPLLAYGGWRGDTAALAAGALAGLLLALVFIAVGGWFPRLVVSEAGVARHDLGFRLGSAWHNVAALRRVGGSEGLVLRAPMDEAGARRLAAAAAGAVPPLRLYPPEVQQLVAQRRFIPLDAFAFWLAHGDLAGELVRHAPWLAAADDHET